MAPSGTAKPTYAQVVSRSPSPEARQSSPLSSPQASRSPSPTEAYAVRTASKSTKGKKKAASTKSKRKGSPRTKFVTKFKSDGGTIEVEVEADSDSGEDAGARVDASDPGYHASTSRNRVKHEEPSIIKTRAHLARERQANTSRSAEEPVVSSSQSINQASGVTKSGGGANHDGSVQDHDDSDDAPLRVSQSAKRSRSRQHARSLAERSESDAEVSPTASRAKRLRTADSSFEDFGIFTQLPAHRSDNDGMDGGDASVDGGGNDSDMDTLSSQDGDVDMVDSVADGDRSEVGSDIEVDHRRLSDGSDVECDASIGGVDEQPVIEDEAMESGDEQMEDIDPEHADSDGGQSIEGSFVRDARNMDEYDDQDSFIDDGSVAQASSDGDDPVVHSAVEPTDVPGEVDVGSALVSPSEPGCAPTVSHSAHASTSLDEAPSTEPAPRTSSSFSSTTESQQKTERPNRRRSGNPPSGQESTKETALSQPDDKVPKARTTGRSKVGRKPEETAPPAPTESLDVGVDVEARVPDGGVIQDRQTAASSKSSKSTQVKTSQRRTSSRTATSVSVPSADPAPCHDSTAATAPSAEPPSLPLPAEQPISSTQKKTRGRKVKVEVPEEARVPPSPAPPASVTAEHSDSTELLDRPKASASSSKSRTKTRSSATAPKSAPSSTKASASTKTAVPSNKSGTTTTKPSSNIPSTSTAPAPPSTKSASVSSASAAASTKTASTSTAKTASDIARSVEPKASSRAGKARSRSSKPVPSTAHGKGTSEKATDVDPSPTQQHGDEAGRGSKEAAVHSTPDDVKAATTGSSQVKPTPTVPAVPQTPARAKGRRTFGSVFKGEKAITPRPVPTLGNSTFHRTRLLPEVCEALDPALQDPILKHLYEDLTPVFGGLFSPWNDVRGGGMVMFSNWAVDAPELDYDSALHAMAFKSYKHYINISRISPLDVLVRELPGPYPRLYLYTADQKVAVCLSAVQVKESYLVEPSPVGMKQKKLHGVFHSQDFERAVGFVCTVFSKKPLSSQLAKDEMQFATRTVFGAHSEPPAPNRLSPSKPSPAVAAASSSTAAPMLDSFTLGVDDTVPVYDCRYIALDLEKDLDRLDTLPRWEDEIPYNSFAIVAYTVSVFRAKPPRNWSVGFNIQWAMLLGAGK
ncbi:hypothetical protein DFP72DRAFT_1068849 [Ephemerocybe angulata]|uniref:Uncharacterized protein n=1 Tax=Ephemerocybe angulata TaxID=980116 RepID=A0A8H6M5P9_9AGAR|nr:hypothetical protein DFP72DRAFT_1068849 [Tulosesus angulatus]